MNDRRPHMFFVMTMLLVFLLLGACQRGPASPQGNEREVAAVNKYKIFVSDFATAVYPPDKAGEISDSPETKKAILEDLITRKALIEEAQKQNLDKQKDFMKEIERYWEQSLLKLLLKRKSQELSHAVGVDKAQVQAEYERRKFRIFADVVSFKNESAADRLSGSGNSFEEVNQALKDEILLDGSGQWWLAGDLPSDIEANLFSLNLSEISKPIKSMDGWVVLRVLKKEEVQILPFAEMALQIKDDLVVRKQQEALAQWARDVRTKAYVRIHEEVLKEIDLKRLREER